MIQFMSWKYKVKNNSKNSHQNIFLYCVYHTYECSDKYHSTPISLTNYLKFLRLLRLQVN